MATTAYGRVFEAPRPGAWEIDLTHFPRAMTNFSSGVFTSEFRRGMAEGTKMYGILLDHIEMVPIHGFMYGAPRPVGAPLDAKGPPPKPIFKLLTWLHPEIRRRIRTSKDAIATRSWLKDLAHWDNVVKPQAIREHLAVQNVDPLALDDRGLVEHLHAAYGNVRNGMYRHGRFTMTACVPVGDYLAHVTAWTGEPAHTLLRAVKGYSAVSSGVATAELDALAGRLRANPAAAALLDRGSPDEVLQALRGAHGGVGEAARAWLDQVGYRMVTGYDVADLYGLEMPDALLSGLRAALRPPVERESLDVAAREVAAVRERVPAAERALFDELLADARAVYRLRDERDHYNDGWSTGLMRRALLEAGRRLVAKGQIDTAGLIVEGTFDEVLALLSGAGPTNDDLRTRAQWRATADGAKLPQQLGFPPSKPPPTEWLPRDAARIANAVNLFIFSLFQPSEAESSVDTLRGIPVSPGVYEGPARVVRGPEDFDAVQQGDVLVTRSTAPYFNVLLPLLGAIVTDRGGALSHAAIVAREYGIPGVVGTKTATDMITTGQRVRVDGAAGEVRIIGA